MTIRDLQEYVFDKVIIYREEEDGFVDIYKGFIYKGFSSEIPSEIVNLKIRHIGAKKKGVLDICVK